MKTAFTCFLWCSFLLACSSNKNLSQTASDSSQDSLIHHINSSTMDTDIVNFKLKSLQQQNDMVIAFGSLNYAWTRKGTFYVLAKKNSDWKLYVYQSKLPPSAEEAAEPTPQNVSTETAEKIKQLYAASSLWSINGDENGNFCSGKKSCNINDAETWTLSISTPQNIHTTTYYAPEFFEECCPENPYRQRFVAIAKEMIKLGGSNSAAPEM